MEKRMRIIAPLIVVLAVGGWLAWRQFGPAASSTETLGGSGTIEARQAQVSSLVAGRIVSAPETEGAGVRAGDVLFVLDDALLRDQVKQAEAGVRAAKANLTNVKGDDASTKADINVAQAQVDAASAALAMAKTQLSYTRILAPSDGSLTAIVGRAGENAAPGQTLATIADLKKLEVSIFVPESKIGKIVLGQTGELKTDSSSESWEAEVVFVASEAEFTPSSVETKEERVKLVYEVRLSVDDPSGVLKPGMPVDVTF